MRRLIARLTETITDFVGNRTAGHDMSGLVTRGLPLFRAARTLLVRLAERAPAGSQVAGPGPMQPAIAAPGGAPLRRRNGLSMLRSGGSHSGWHGYARPSGRRRVEPGTGATPGEF